MKSKKLVLSCLSIPLFLVVSGCGLFGSNEAAGDDLEFYMNETILPIEDDVFAAWDDFYIETDELSDEEFYEQYQSSLKPELDEYYEEFHAIQPETEEVQNLHAIYLERNEIYWEAGEKEVEGHYQGDQDLLDEADELFIEFEEHTEFRDELERLMDKHNIEYE
ncbi:hypothetical protein [Alkalicoccobacillus murimartini]|uniref:Lipoprotein n=1 Tax=Alkalicoccobacillus murimartini TaxID=171685 RepID=A0ABT9YGB0_9BACI|nr:hypothetical protein [Alkalicoccobacillus murimartini]MDQ0206099.1 hypothetical protein [Alkalicoccobacillus murimartini]